MACLPHSGGCERRNTEPFVEHLNSAEGTGYRHEACLDLTPSDRPQPEALYVDPSSGARLTIERKSLIWPADYAQRHQNDHLVAGRIFDQVGAALRQAPFQLQLPDLIQGSRRELLAFADEVSRCVLVKFSSLEPGATFQGVSGRWGWRLRRQHEVEREEDEPTSGLIVNWSSSIDYLTPEACAEARAGLAPELMRFFDACSRKFLGYEDTRRVLLLERIGNYYLGEDDWTAILTDSPPPPQVDEVWLSECFVGAEDYWDFERVFPRAPNPLPDA